MDWRGNAIWKRGSSWILKIVGGRASEAITEVRRNRRNHPCSQENGVDRTQLTVPAVAPPSNHLFRLSSNIDEVHMLRVHIQEQRPRWVETRCPSAAQHLRARKIGTWHLCKCLCFMHQLDSSIFNEINHEASREITVVLMFEGTYLVYKNHTISFALVSLYHFLLPVHISNTPHPIPNLLNRPSASSVLSHSVISYQRPENTMNDPLASKAPDIQTERSQPWNSTTSLIL